MKKLLILLFASLTLQAVTSCSNQSKDDCCKNENTTAVSKEATTKKDTNSLGLVIYSNDVETIWNAYRLANKAIEKGDKVTIFLLGKGVELDNLVKTNEDLKTQSELFSKNGGTTLGCGTCLESRNIGEPQTCEFSSMSDLYEVIQQNNKVLTF